MKTAYSVALEVSYIKNGQLDVAIYATRERVMNSTYKSYTHEQTFIRVVEMGSIRAVARERNVEPSSISRKINSLEKRLRVKLLDRTGGHSKVTESGTLYFNSIKVLLDQIEALEMKVSGEEDTPKGLLKITASIDFGQTLVVPWLLEFRELYPDVQVELVLSSEFKNLSMDEFDVAIRIGELKDSALIARKLASVPRILVASKDYLSHSSIPKTPEELEGHEFVFFRASNRKKPLTVNDKSGKEYKLNCHGSVTVNAVNSVIQAVRSGCGMNMGPRWAFLKYVESGELVEILPNLRLPSPSMYAIWKPAAVQPARIRAFVNFIAQKAKSVPGLE